ncbi:MAG TPA: RtcB family protein, partial [Gemmatimonadales bacterium]|nr:RtcB family protein [Gemmatimonadales bacterium]
MPAVLQELAHEIPVTAQPGMRVPAVIYADDELWEQIGHDRSLAQIRNVATLPGVTGAVYGMPDMHEGYGFPVGGVAAMRLSDGVISPGGVGYDINCGVRLLASRLRAERIAAKLPGLVHEISRSVPSGAGRGGRLSFSDAELDRVFVEGCRYLAERALAEPDD